MVLLGAVAERRSLPAWSWLLMLGLGMMLSLWIAGGGYFWFFVLSFPLLALALVIGIPAARMRLITVPWAERIRQSLQELEAVPETTWQQNLMMGRLPKVEKTPRLNQDEEDFLETETAALCQQWRKARQKKAGVSPDLLRFLAEKGFNRLRLSDAYEGKNFSLAAVSSILTKLATCDMELAQLVAHLDGGSAIERYGSGSQQRKYLPLIAAENYFIYRLDEGEIKTKEIYGIVCEGTHRKRAQLGLQLHWRDLELPPFVNLIQLVVPFYDPQKLLETPETDERNYVCLLLSPELLKEQKNKTIFVPMSQALAMKNEEVIPALSREIVTHSLALACGYLLNLTHQASAGAAALSRLDNSIDSSALAGLAYELTCLQRVEELSLQLLKQGEKITESDLNGITSHSLSRTTMFTTGLSANQRRLSRMPPPLFCGSSSPLQLKGAISMHKHWREMVENINQQGKEDEILNKLLAHYGRSILRCCSLGISWGWIAKPHPDLSDNRLRRVTHLRLALNLTMDMILFNAIMFMRPLPQCDGAWQSFLVMLALAREETGAVEEEEWKTAVSLSQQEIVRLLSSLALPPFLRLLLRWTIFPWGRNYSARTEEEDASLATGLMVPSQERETLFRLMDKHSADYQDAQELLKLSWLVRDIYAAIKEKKLTRPWSMDELSWYKDLCKSKHISAKDVQIMSDFYSRAMTFLQ